MKSLLPFKKLPVVMGILAYQKPDIRQFLRVKNRPCSSRPTYSFLKTLSKIARLKFESSEKKILATQI